MPHPDRNQVPSLSCLLPPTLLTASECSECISTARLPGTYWTEPIPLSHLDGPDECQLVGAEGCIYGMSLQACLFRSRLVHGESVHGSIAWCRQRVPRHQTARRSLTVAGPGSGTFTRTRPLSCAAQKVPGLEVHAARGGKVVAVGWYRRDWERCRSLNTSQK